MTEIVLIAPQIANNTGSIIRLAANLGFGLHLVEPLGFRLDEPDLKRAGLDYHDLATTQVHIDWPTTRVVLSDRQLLAFSADADRSFEDVTIEPDAALIFGCETEGLPRELRTELPLAYIPMLPANRSMNLANAVAIAAYETWRRQGHPGSRRPNLNPSEAPVPL